MMENEERPNGIGVVVGRFQVHDLHDGHKHLIDHVRERHDQTLVVIGVAPIPSSHKNPLSFEIRKHIVLNHFPDTTVVPLLDHPSDEQWSNNLDYLIASHSDEAILYGSRDSFAEYYSGKFPVFTIANKNNVSGTDIRKMLVDGVEAKDPTLFAEGAIWASGSQYPKVFSTVDAVVFADREHTHILMGNKTGLDGLFFPGGFADPDSNSDEEDIVREVHEECDVWIKFPTYLCSKQVDDWRYRYEVDKIRTRLFWSEAIIPFDNCVEKDDLLNPRWVKIEEIRREDIAGCHQPLWDEVVYRLLENKNDEVEGSGASSA